jgi:hypothetical protein
MIVAILEGQGRPSTRQNVAVFLNHGESQLEWYEALTSRVPGAVLRRGCTKKSVVTVFRRLKPVQVKGVVNAHPEHAWIYR